VEDIFFTDLKHQIKKDQKQHCF